MDTKQPNLLDPDFEPTDEQLAEIAESFLRAVLEAQGRLTPPPLPAGRADEGA